MATNQYADGNVVEYTNTTGSTITSGSGVVVGDMLGVALVDIPDTESGAVAVSGVWKLAATTTAFSQGDKLVFNGTALLAATGPIHGYAYADKGAGVLEGYVCLNPSGA